MTLKAEIVDVAEVTQAQREQMMQLMERYYCNVAEERFNNDLCQKDWVILLQDNGRIHGFSTQQLFDHDIDGRRVNVVFSGDTVIERCYQRSFALPVAWWKMMCGIFRRDSETDLYWLLTTKGYKTYRYLPVFFREFYPAYHRAIPPPERALLCSIAKRKFNGRFDPDRLVLLGNNGCQRLRSGVADISDRKRRDRHIAFFERANPGHADGEELVCLARWHVENIRPSFIQRVER